MGASEGTRPEDDPFTRSISRRTDAQGYMRGSEAGYEKGRSETLEANLRAVLRARGIEAALDSKEDRELFGALSGEALMTAALACTGEADFRRRIREQLALPSGLLP